MTLIILLSFHPFVGTSTPIISIDGEDGDIELPRKSTFSSSNEFDEVQNPDDYSGHDIDYTPWNITHYTNKYSKTDSSDQYITFVLNKNSNWNLSYSIEVVAVDGSEHYSYSLDGIYVGWSDVVSHVFNSTTVYIRVANGVFLWNFKTNTTKNIIMENYNRKPGATHPGIPKIHHDVEYNPRTNTFLILERYNYFYEPTNNTYQFDLIHEIDWNGNIIDTIDTMDWVPFDYWEGEKIFDTADLTHTNSIFWDIDTNMIYANMRNINTMYKINKTSGNMIWGLGEHGNFTQIDKFGKVKPTLFYHAHAAEKIDDNKFILFNNNFWNKSDPTEAEKLSSMVEIEVNTTSMIAYETWRYQAPSTYYSPIVSDADRLPDGNRVGVFGTRTHPNTNIGARILEVDEKGNRIWEMNFPKVKNDTYLVYRAERFQITPKVISHTNLEQNIDMLQNDTITYDFNIWSIFNTRFTDTGTATIYMNNSKISQVNFNVTSFWRPTTISIPVYGETVGTNNLRFDFQLLDGANFSVSTQLNVHSEFYLTYNGIYEDEYQNPDSIYQWIGQSRVPLDYELKLDGTIVGTGIWSNGTITLDTDIPVGEHIIGLELKNSTDTVVYRDIVSIIILEQLDPTIDVIDFNNATTNIRYWGDIIQLDIEISDYSLVNFSLLFDNSIENSITVSETTYTYNWSLPTLDEGEYNLTIIATDAIGLQSQFDINLSVLPPSTPKALHPEQIYFEWKDSSKQIEWEVHGADTYSILLDSTKLIEGVIDSKALIFSADEILPGTYNLNLKLMNDQDDVRIYTSLLHIEFIWGNPYVEAILTKQSLEYNDGENIIGAPDNKSASIYSGYSPGYLTVDMGDPIIDGTNYDTRIFVTGGRYSIHVATKDNGNFTKVFEGEGSTYIDLEEFNINEIRFLQFRVEGQDTVFIDAVEAIHYEQPEKDDDPPQVNDPGDMKITDRSRSMVNITWIASDAYPWNYSISVNDKHVDQVRWNGENISYILEIEANLINTQYIVVIEVQDIFRKSTSQQIVITIQFDEVKTIFVSSIAILTISMVVFRKRLMRKYRNLVTKI